MQKPILNIVRYIDGDVVATSCIQMPNMSDESYYFWGDSCDWALEGTAIASKNRDSFTFYNEKGKEITVEFDDAEKYNFTWFHYDDQGKFELCTDKKHRHIY